VPTPIFGTEALLLLLLNCPGLISEKRKQHKFSHQGFLLCL